MFCTNCGSPLRDGTKFCTNCGSPVWVPQTAAQEPVAEEPAAPEPVTEELTAPISALPNAGPRSDAVSAPVKAGKPKKKSHLGLILGIAAGVVVLGAALVFLLIILPEQKRVRQYNAGVDYLEEKNYEMAEDVFAALGSYADSEDLRAYAERGVAYKKAVKNMERENYREALDVFSGDPSFEDAQRFGNTCQAYLNLEEAATLYEQGEYEQALLILNEQYKLDAEVDEKGSELADKCRRMMLFNEAKALYEHGDYQGTLDMFERYQIADIDGADAIMSDCTKQLGYQKIAELMNNGSYRDALDLLNADTGAGMEDRAARIAECSNRIGYADAEAALRNGHNYDAYVAFKALGSFEDAADRANSCIVSMPKTSETYHNSAYKSSSVTLKIMPPKDGTNNYIKIYIVEGDSQKLVSGMFIRSGETLAVKPPVGTYIFKVAYSSGDWFGETDMFGDNGTYQRLKINNGDSFTLTRGQWELKLRQQTGNGNVETAKENRGTF